MIRGGIVMLNVSSVGRSVRFYVETLGMKLVADADGTAVVDAGEGFLIGLRRSAREETTAPAILLYPKVPIDEAIAILENRGITFSIERTEHAVVAHFVDPDDNAFSLVEPRVGQPLASQS